MSIVIERNLLHIGTSHQFILRSAQKMEEIAYNSVQLVVSSPPYPMIEMWDKIFS